MTSAKLPVRPLTLKIEPKMVDDQTSLIEALKRFELEDQTFGFTIDPESGETILSGQSEMHLDLKIHRLIHDFNIGVICGAPQVAYREYLSRHATVDYTHKKAVGAAQQFARVKILISPNAVDQENEFNVSAEAGTMPEIYIAAVKKAAQSIWNNGILIGFPIINMKVSLLEGQHNDHLSSATAFEIATRAAIKEACNNAGIAILEPIMDVRILCPSLSLGRMLGNIHGRRGQVFDQSMTAQNQVSFKAYVPISNMFGFATDLRNLSNGDGSYEMHFHRYAPVPPSGSDPDNFPPAVGMRA